MAIMLNEEFSRCKKYLDALNINYDKNTTVKVNYRLSSGAWGVCHGKGNYHYIDVNSSLLKIDSPVKSLQNVLIHELLHTVPGCMNHGTNWKAVADIVNSKGYYHITRTNTSTEYGIALPKREYKYVFKCSGCGQTIRRKNYSDFCKNYTHYKCGICGEKFKPFTEK